MQSSIVPLQGRTPDTVLSVQHLKKIYPGGTMAVNNVSASVGSGDFIAIIGSSGAGKSTFLRCLNRLVKPTEGDVFLNGKNITAASGNELKQVRRRVGMIFQQFNLVRRLTVIENVMAGRLRFASSPVAFGSAVLRHFSKEDKAIAFDCLKQVGISDHAFKRADALSGGQQQRVAIARTLAQEPEIILADEPIASLDPKSAETVMGILNDIHETRHIPVLVNLHHIDFARRYGKRIIGMKAGEIVYDDSPGHLNNDVTGYIYGETTDMCDTRISA